MRGQSIHVGVNDVDPHAYPDTKLSPLRAAERDAATLHRLVAREGLDARMLLGSAATCAAVEAAILAAAAALDAGDLCVITFSGHGGRVSDLDGDEGDDDEYWGLCDGRLIDDRIHELLAAFRRGVRVLVVSDSCFSGTIIRRRRQVPAVGRQLEASVILFAACTEDGRTYEGSTHGLFTRVVLATWRDGAFRGNHRVFHELVRAAIPSAAIMLDGPVDPLFEEARPFTIHPETNRFVPPLKVHLCWFADARADRACAAIAREIYELLHRPIDDDPVQRPGPEIPVEYGRDLAGLLAALEQPPHYVDHEPEVTARLVVVILDRAAYGSKVHRATMKRALARWPLPGDAAPCETLLPIVLHEPWHRVLRENDTRALTAITVDASTSARRWSVPAEVAVAAGRTLLRALGDPAPPPPQVLVSYRQPEGADLAFFLAAHLAQRAHLRVRLGEDDADRGEPLLVHLERAAGHHVVLVIRTDGYSEDPTCDLVLTAAKQARAPMVTLLHGRDGEAVSSTYGGNHRTVVWRDDRAWEVTARCVQAWLHTHHFAAHAAAALAHAGLPANAEILPRRPELLDLARLASAGGQRILVYPDPPLIERHVATLRAAAPALRLMTPNTMLGRVLLAADPHPPLAGCTVALSLSTAEDLPAFQDAGGGNGLTRLHLDDVLYTIVLATLQSGARIAYGGDFRNHEGYAAKLSGLLRSRGRLGTGASSQLVAFVEDDGARTGDADVDYLPQPVTVPPGIDGRPDEVRDVLWTMAMRATMTQACDARIVLGGQLAAAEDDRGPGYRGPWPGVLEEAARTLDAGQALYLIGGLGGAAGLLAQMLLRDEVPDRLTTGPVAGTRLARVHAGVTAARAELLAAGGDRSIFLGEDDGTPRTAAGLALRILESWRAFRRGDGEAWKNGLSVGDNQRLLRSTDRTEIAQLIFAGLRQVNRRAVGDLGLVLYHGDIASVGEVDGYAVTTTGGMRNVGALDALDRRMSGRLGRKVASDPTMAPVLPVAVETTSLPGRLVLVARLDLPGAEAPLAAVGDLATAVARAADDTGLTSIAMVPFGTTLGIDTAASVRALVGGINRGRGGNPLRLVLCEVDPARYQAMRAALADVKGLAFQSTGGIARHVAPFIELRAGSRGARNIDTAVLHVDAITDPADRSVRLRITAYAPAAGDAVIPHDEVTVSASQWQALQRRPAQFAASLEVGRSLQALVLHERLRQRLRPHAGGRILLIANDLASALPWETLEAPLGDAPSIGMSMVRRIAMSRDARPPADRASADFVLRVLLVVDPEQNLAGAAAEGAMIAAALRQRPGVEVTILCGVEATRANLSRELATGTYDIFHYAGHASFDIRGNTSVLHLAGVTFSADDLAALRDVPRLVVMSACETAQLGASDPGAEAAAAVGDQPLAAAFLRAGVTTLVGTFFPVSDRAAHSFARTFYASLVAGKPVGDAVVESRRELHRRSEDDWSNFLIYGDDGLIV